MSNSDQDRTPRPPTPKAPTYSDDELDAITDATVDSYQGVAERFWQGTCDHDVSQNRNALLQALVEANIAATDGGYDVLDFGCGPGRDLRIFCELGHRPVGLDATPRFAEMARDYAGVECWQQNFLALDLPAQRFDGVFCNASLFHVPTSEIERVLGELRSCLRPGGMFFMSNPRGHDQEGATGDQRYGCWRRDETWRNLLVAAGFDEVHTYYRPPGAPIESAAWFAGVWQKRAEVS